jgi:hypothetical protein
MIYIFLFILGLNVTPDISDSYFSMRRLVIAYYFADFLC